MPIIVNDKNFILNAGEVEKLWQEVMERRQWTDELVTLQTVEKQEIKRLNRRYRRLNKETNILTFSYGQGEHDIAICLEVARREAKQRKIALRSYIAILMTHALLHVTGMDHEQSNEDARTMAELEESIVESLGLATDHL